MNKQFAVFGVGKFGESVAVELQRLGCEVIAVDKDMERVEHIADSVSYAMQADFGDPDFIHSLGTRNLDGVVIAESVNLEALKKSLILEFIVFSPFIISSDSA